MNVTELKARLEALEAQGLGETKVGVRTNRTHNRKSVPVDQEIHNIATQLSVDAVSPWQGISPGERYVRLVFD